MDRKLRISGRDIIGYLFLGISVIMLFKSLMLCFSNDIWYDELFTVGMIEHSYGDLIAFTARDVHPPLYYCIVKFFVDLCELISAQVDPVVAAKAVSILPFFILLLYSVTFIRRRFGIFTGGLFIFCSITMPQLSSYMVEMRMYSYALLFVTAAFLHAYGTVTAGKKIPGKEASSNMGGSADEGVQEVGQDTVLQKAVGYARGHMRQIHGAGLVFYGLAAAYTQYFACVAVIMVYLYVLAVFLIRDRGRIKEWILWVVISAACYVPWLFVLFSQITTVRENYWILPLTWRSLGGCVKFLMKPAFTNEILSTGLAVVLFAAYALAVLYPTTKLYHNGRENKKKGVKCARAVKYEESSITYQKNDVKYEESSVIDHGNGIKRRERVRSSGAGEAGWKIGFMFAGICVLAGLVLFGFAASMLIRPIFVYRYMLSAMGCFWLSFAVGVNFLFRESSIQVSETDFTMDQKAGEQQRESDAIYGQAELCKHTGKRWVWQRLLFWAVTALVLVIGLRDYRAFMGEEEYKTLLMKDTAEALSSIAPADIVLYNFDQVQAVTSYYLDEENGSYLWCGKPETLIQEILRPYGTVEQTEQIRTWCEEDRSVWFIGSFNSRDDIVENWERDGLQAEETGSYLLERYWFNLYKISSAGQ